MGINANTRALEKNNICCVLLDANIEPPLLVKHVVIMAQNKKVPVLLLPVLKAVTLETIGFAVAAVGLKVKNVFFFISNLYLFHESLNNLSLSA